MVPESGTPRKSASAAHRSWVETVRLAEDVAREMLKLSVKGRSCGGVKSAAIKIVAKQRGYGYEGLRKRLNGFDLTNDFFTRKGSPWPLSKVVFRGREISQLLNESEEKVRIERDEAKERELVEMRKTLSSGAWPPAMAADCDRENNPLILFPAKLLICKPMRPLPQRKGLQNAQTIHPQARIPSTAWLL